MILAKYLSGNFEFILKSEEKIVLEYRKKGFKKWNHKNYSDNTNRARIEKDIKKISGCNNFKMQYGN